MEKRRYYRKNINLGTKIISSGKNSVGFINNISKNGLLIVTTSLKTARDFTNGKTLDLEFQSRLGEILFLKCIIKWLRKTPPLDLTNSIGLEIIDKPAEYEEFIKSL